MRKRGRKAQLTIFIIIAILIVAGVLFIFLFWPKIDWRVSETENPYEYIQQCTEDNIEETIEIILENGGDYNLDEGIAFLHQGKYYKFLCHTNEYFETCYRQVAFLKDHIEKEIFANTENEINNCFQSMIDKYELEGYDVTVRDNGEMEVRILPQGISYEFNRDLVLTKGDETKEYRNFNLNIPSKLYEILEVVDNILVFEQELGGSIPQSYMYSYPKIDITKELWDWGGYEDTRIYIITHSETRESFKFASRSGSLPAVPEVRFE